MSASAMVTGDRPYLLGKSFFEILPLKLSRVTVANDTCWWFEQNRKVRLHEILSFLTMVQHYAYHMNIHILSYWEL